MKFQLVQLLGALSAAGAFAPPSNRPRERNPSPSMLRMSDEPVDQEKVPCFGAAPFLGGTLFLGEGVWDKLTMEMGSDDTGKFLQAAELKHGRSAMLATVGFAFHKLGLTLDNISPHEYLSVTENIKFADLAAMTPVEAMKSLPALGYGQMFTAIAMIELYEMTFRNGEFVTGEGIAPGLKSGGLNGDLGWNPLDIKIDDRRRLVEIQNGRAAMFAISAWIAADTVPGSMPLPLPW